MGFLFAFGLSSLGNGHNPCPRLKLDSKSPPLLKSSTLSKKLNDYLKKQFSLFVSSNTVSSKKLLAIKFAYDGIMTVDQPLYQIEHPKKLYS